VPGSTLLRHVPNALSAARILAVPVLLVLAWQGRQDPFKWLLLAALLSDIADGLIARLGGFTSKLGALLDSIGDTLVFFTAAWGTWVFHPEVVREHGTLMAALLGSWLFENVAALLRYGRLSSFHTYLSRIAAYALGIFVMVMFLFGQQDWLMYVAVGIALAATVEELVLLALLPQWRSDVRGAWWVLRERRAGAP
jgi:CDP-diacylglycerol--glycerol-3-phosphate 3-phosphatidyltransferase